jgi:FtsP/CotA-like multicopper oxidase with cupredoxin domain
MLPHFPSQHLSISALLFLTATTSHAEIVEYSITVAEQRWAPPGHRAAPAITLDGSIPGPTLTFQVGQTARIHVHNQLAEDTSVHWHGILLPNEQDGVPYVTTPPIPPGGSHTFEFPLTHAGTYWYHSHSGLQEQRGHYGAIVVKPAAPDPIQADVDQVLLLSDWTRESPETVMRTLMRGSHWYEQRRGTAQSILGAIRAGALKEYWQRERVNMPPMDISDVAYDAFLANGTTSFQLPGEPGQKIRLRLINAGAATYFYVQSATGPLQIVAADGPAVSPIQVHRLLIGVAETYDVLVTVPPSGRWEIRATAMDGSGHASAWLGQGDPHRAPTIPMPDLYRMDDHLLAALRQPSAPASDAEALAEEPDRPLSPYHRLRSPHPTSLPAAWPRRQLTLRLTGTMERYSWSFDGKSFKEAGLIPIRHGEVIELRLINDTMMHHPLHLHGHFFRVIQDPENPDPNAPLKHTIDVPPMATRHIEFAADEIGDWLFHCHLLYHMHAGMTRIFTYEDQGEHHQPDPGEHDEYSLMPMLEGTIETHMSMGMAMLMGANDDFYLMWDIGFDHDTHQEHRHHHGHHDDADSYSYEIDLGWRHFYNPNLATSVGWRFTNHPRARDRAFAALEYRLPYFIETSVQLDSEGDLRLALARSFALTNRIELHAEIEYDTLSGWEYSTQASYALSRQFSLVFGYHSDHGLGAGLGFEF